MAEKRQSSLFVQLKDVPSPETARISKLRVNKTRNGEHEEENSIDDEVDDYFVSGDNTMGQRSQKSFKIPALVLTLDL